MAAPLTTQAFLEVCLRSGLYDQKQLEQISSRISLPDDPAKAAQLLVQHSYLTKFQARLLLAGKHKGFFIGQLKLIDQIGAGGMGMVYLCEHVGLSRKVAVKVLPVQQAKERANRERFLREARAVAALDHPNIIRIHDVNTSGEVNYLTMEYVQGTDLAKELEKNGPMATRRAVTFAVQAAEGLLHAHDRGIVHRDIKPSNLIVDSSGRLKILDMGLARFRESAQDHVTQEFEPKAILGTLEFLAPEQASASSNVDHRADIYSLGATLHTLLTGKPPFAGNSTQKMIALQVQTPDRVDLVRPDIPELLADVVATMMNKKPDERFQNMNEVIAALQPWVDESLLGDPASTRSRVMATGVRKEMLAALSRKKKGASPSRFIPAFVLGVSLAVGGGAAAWYFLGKSNADGRATPTVVAAAKNEPAAEEPPTMAPPKAETPVVNKAVEPEPIVGELPPRAVAKLPEKAGVLMHSFRFDQLPPGVRTIKRSEVVAESGSLAGLPNWSMQSLNGDGTARFEVAPLTDPRDGRPANALHMSNSEAEGSMASLGMLFERGRIPLFAGLHYRLRIEYWFDPKGAVSVTIRGLHANTAEAMYQLYGSGQGWQSVDLALDPVQDGFLNLGIHRYDRVAGVRFAIRRIDLFAVDPAAETRLPLYRLDLEPAVGFTGRYLGDAVVSQEGTPPAGWKFNSWAPDSRSEVSVSAGAKAGSPPELTHRNVEGKPGASAQCSEKSMKLRAGRRYAVAAEFNTASQGYSSLMLVDRAGSGNLVGIALRATADDFARVEVVVSPRADCEAQVAFNNIDEKRPITIRSLSVSELVQSAANPAARLLLEAKPQPFEIRLLGKTVVEETGPGGLPAGWGVEAWKADTLASVTGEVIDAQPCIALKNISGEPSVQLSTKSWMPSELPELKAGHRYRVAVKYRTAGTGAVNVSLRNPNRTRSDDGWINYSPPPLPGAWRTALLLADLTKAGKPALVIQNFAGGEQNAVYIQGIELTDLGVSPAERERSPFSFRIPSDWKPFTDTFEGNKLLGHEGQGTLFPDWAALCWKPKSRGQVGVELLDDRLALFLRHLSGDPAMQMVSRKPLLGVEAGKKYRVRVRYRGGDDTGYILKVYQKGKEEGTLTVDLTSSSSGWATKEGIYEPKTSGEASMLIQVYGKVEGATIYIDQIDIDPAE